MLIASNVSMFITGVHSLSSCHNLLHWHHNTALQCENCNAHCVLSNTQWQPGQSCESPTQIHRINTSAALKHRGH